MLYKQVVFLAGAKPAELLIDELVVVSSAAPPRGLASTARPPRDAAGSPGWCEYLSSEFDRVGRHAARSGNGEAQGGGGSFCARSALVGAAAAAAAALALSFASRPR
mgnify:CR=1 FL=1